MRPFMMLKISGASKPGGQRYALSIAILLITGGLVLVPLGHEVIGLVLSTGTVTALVTAFLLGRSAPRISEPTEGNHKPNDEREVVKS